MREIDFTRKFLRDLKRETKADPAFAEVLQPIIDRLAGDIQLPKRLRDHALSGNWKGLRDCHVKPDLVLIYEKREGVLILARLGSHSQVFG